MTRFFSLLPLLVTLLGFSAQAQVVYFENFQNGMPSNITLINQDGLTPNAAVNYITSAWVVRDDFGSTDSAAVSTSWYTPVGVANDWLITPAIAIGSNARLSFQMRSQDPDFLEHYQVLISTTGTTLADFTDTVYENIEEQATDIVRNIDLAAEGYANTTIYVAFRNISDDQFVLVLDDIKVKNVPNNDASVTEVILPDPSCTLTNAEQVNIAILNDGLAAISNFDVSYSLNGATPVTETYTATIQPGQTANYSFTQTVDFSATNTVFEVVAFISTPDGDVTNDTAAATATINVASTDVSANGYETSFETNAQILGWTTEDVNNDGFDFGLIQGNAYDGDLSFAYLYNTNSNANDWLHSTCLDLQGGQAYRLDFYYAVGESQGTVFPERFSVHYGNAPQSTAMTNLLKDYGAVSNTEYLQGALGFTPATTGTYYVGFRCYSLADQFLFTLDQISLGELVAPTASFTFNTADFDAAFTSPQGNDPINTLTWDFGDGNDTSVSGQSGYIHTYADTGSFIVCLTVSNIAGSATFCDTVTIDTATTSGIITKNIQTLKTFPNPANELVNIVLNNASVANVTIINTLGEVIINETTKGNKLHSINTATLANGIYVIEVQQEGICYIGRMSIAH